MISLKNLEICFKTEKVLIDLFISWQGEGLTHGQISVFIRFSGCNLRCKWCDTKDFSFYKPKIKEKTLEDVINFIKKSKIKKVVFTGGEPLLFQEEIIKILQNLKLKSVEFETNGTLLLKKNFIDFLKNYRASKIFNISPKPQESQINKVNTESLLIKQLKSLKFRWITKFIIENEKDKEFALKIIKKYKIPKEKVFIQPNCTDSEGCIKKLRELLPWIKEKKFNISPRTHIILGIK